MSEESRLSQRGRIWLITGEPGVGKSTAISRIIFRLRSQGFTVGGIITREIRSHGEREGFAVTDVSSEETADLASSVKPISGPRIGKYRVDLKSLSSLGVKALKHAKEKSDAIVCDEVGPMELLSPEFRKAISEYILHATDKPSICTIHKRLVDPLIDELRNSKRATILEITYENREELPDEVADDIILALSRE